LPTLPMFTIADTADSLASSFCAQAYQYICC
jgi:hypothetical protein